MTFKYNVIKSTKRKTLAIQVRSGQVTVRAPYFVNHTSINAFVKDKEQWLKIKVKQQLDYMAKVESLTYLPDSYFLYRGVRKKIKVSHALTPSVEFYQHHVEIALKEFAENSRNTSIEKLIKKKLESTLLTEARAELPERVEYWQKVCGLVAHDLSIKRYKARWGSCNNRGEVSLNSLLMMCPTFVQDYVIIHELCHLRYLNHSPEFWNLVGQYASNYKQAKKWFVDNKSLLVF